MRIEVDAAPAGTVVEVEPLVPEPYDLDGWRRRIVARALGGAEPTGVESASTALGSPMELIEGNGRVVALYRFVDHVAAAVARGGSRAAMVAVLRSARPDWRGDDIVCLAELWEPEPDRQVIGLTDER